MFSKKIRLDKGKTISVATALVLLAIDEIIESPGNENKTVYGYQIMTHLRENFHWDVKSGTVYPILKKLDLDLLIRKGFVPEIDPETKRQMIYYKMTPKGERIVKSLKALNDEALDAALARDEDESFDLRMDRRGKFSFPPDNFTHAYLVPFLIGFVKHVSNLVNMDNTSVEYEKLKNEIQAAIDQLHTQISLLENELKRIETFQSFHR